MSFVLAPQSKQREKQFWIFLNTVYYIFQMYEGLGGGMYFIDHYIQPQT